MSALHDAEHALRRGDLAAAVEALQLADTARGQHAQRSEARALLTQLWAVMHYPTALCPRAGADDVARRGSCATLEKRVSSLSRGKGLPVLALESPYHVKLMLVGDANVGKTSLLYTVANGHFPEDYCPNHAEYGMGAKAFRMVDGCTAVIAAWDSAGQVDYVRLRPLSYPQTDIFVIAYSVDSRESFEAVAHSWMPELLFHNTLSKHVQNVNSSHVRRGDAPEDGQIWRQPFNSPLHGTYAMPPVALH